MAPLALRFVGGLSVSDPGMIAATVIVAVAVFAWLAAIYFGDDDQAGGWR
jgi:hypothetical protein